MSNNFSKVFGFIFVQPIHKTLRQMRVATIVLLGVSIHMMYKIIGIFERSDAISDNQSIAALAVLAGTLMTTIWKGIQNLADPHKDDD